MAKVIVIDAVTGNVIEREQTDAELEQETNDAVEAQALAVTAAEKVTAREALLTKLGITADEAQLLLGGM